MITATVKFFGAEQDQFGMPTPYHSYFVTASDGPTPDSAIATALPLSAETPPLSPPHEYSAKGGHRAAYDALLARLRAHSSNVALKESVSAK